MLGCCHPLRRRHPPAKEIPPAKEAPPCAKETSLPRRPPQKETPQKEAPQEGGTPSQGDPLPRRLPQKEAPPRKETPPPGPHPRGKLRGIRSRPTPKGEIEGDQIQAHTQGGSDPGPHPRGKLRGIRSNPPPRRHMVNERPVRILLECILGFRACPFLFSVREFAEKTL